MDPSSHILQVHSFLAIEDPLKTQQDVLSPLWPHPPPPPHSNIRAHLHQGSRQAETQTINSPRHCGLFVLLDIVLYLYGIQANLSFLAPLLWAHQLKEGDACITTYHPILSFCFLDCQSSFLPLPQPPPTACLALDCQLASYDWHQGLRCGVVWLRDVGGVLQLPR